MMVGLVVFSHHIRKKVSFKNKIDEKDKVIVKSNEPILVEKPVPRKKLRFWNKLFPNLDSRNLTEENFDEVEVQKTETEKKTFLNFRINLSRLKLKTEK